MFVRWMKFNAVGAAGVIVQIGALWMLVEFGKINLLVATLAATEAALLHNFLWHSHWTWSDRRVSLANSCARFVRFNLSNGTVSLIGNLSVVAVLTGFVKVPYLQANLIAIGICALVNFLLSDAWVFG